MLERLLLRSVNETATTLSQSADGLKKENMAMRKTWLLALAITLSACSTHYDTSKEAGVDGHKIYRMSQEQAFAIASHQT